MPDQPPLITDAAPSLHDNQARRRRHYAILMAVHLVGFALSYPLYLWQPWAGTAAVIATGALPWVAVLIANGAPRRSRTTPAPSPTRSRPAPADAAAPTVIDGGQPDHRER